MNKLWFQDHLCRCFLILTPHLGMKTWTSHCPLLGSHTLFLLFCVWNVSERIHHHSLPIYLCCYRSLRCWPHCMPFIRCTACSIWTGVPFLPRGCLLSFGFLLHIQQRSESVKKLTYLSIVACFDSDPYFSKIISFLFVLVPYWPWLRMEKAARTSYSMLCVYIAHWNPCMLSRTAITPQQRYTHLFLSC